MDPRLYVSRVLLRAINEQWHAIDAWDVAYRLLNNAALMDHEVADPHEMVVYPWVGCLHPGAMDSLERTWPELWRAMIRPGGNINCRCQE